MGNQPLPACDHSDADNLGVDARWVILVGCGAATAIGTAIAAQVYLSMLDHGHAFTRMLAWQVSSWCFWGLVAAFVLRLGSGLSIEHGRSGRAVRIALIGAAFCAVHLIATAQLTVWFQPFLPLPPPTFSEAFAGQIASTLLVDLLVFGLLLAAGSVIGAGTARARSSVARRASRWSWRGRAPVIVQLESGPGFHHHRQPDLPVGNPQVPCGHREPRVRRPERQSPNQGGRQEMRIDPPNPEPVQPTVSDELEDLAVRHDRRVMHLLVVRQQLLPSSLVPDQEFAVNELMAADFVPAQESIQLVGEWLTVGKKANPDRRIDEDDHAAERLPDLPRLRRRGALRA